MERVREGTGRAGGKQPQGPALPAKSAEIELDQGRKPLERGKEVELICVII